MNARLWTAAVVAALALACARIAAVPRQSPDLDASVEVAARAAVRPTVVWRGWNEEFDFARRGEGATRSSELAVLVRDVVRPDLGLPNARVDAIQLIDGVFMDAGATSTSAAGFWPPPEGRATGMTEPTLMLAGEARYIVRISAAGYRPMDVLVEVTPACRAALEVYLQPGYRSPAPARDASTPVATRPRLPAPRALLTNCE